MREAWQQITEGLSQIGGEDPAVRGAVLLGTGVLAASTFALSWWRGRRPERTRISVDAPAGEQIEIRTTNKEA